MSGAVVYYDDEEPAVEPTYQEKCKKKAADGAHAAAEAARLASQLEWKTRRSIDARNLYNSQVPRVPLSESAFETERCRTAPPSNVPTSPYCQKSERLGPSLQGVPLPDAPQFAAISSKVRAIKAKPISVNDADALAAVLAVPSSAVERLELTGALHSAAEPPIPADLLGVAVTALEAEFPQGAEETNERLQAAVEKLKGEFTTYEAGIEFLASKRLNRYQKVFAALLKNKTVTDVLLNNNGLGAPNEEGKANYQPLRRLGKVIDLNKSIKVIDLSGNGMGPVGAGIIAKAMCKNISIHTLDLSGNDIVGEAPEEEEDPELEEDDTVFGELYQSLDSLSEMIKKNKFLRNLSLRHNGIKAEIDEAGEDDGVETPLGKFLEPFKKYHRLEALDLSSNELGAAGARMIANALAQNQSVRVLDVSDNNLGPRGLFHLAKLLSTTEYIDTLLVRKNDLTGKKGKRAQKEAMEAMNSFAAAIAANKTLVHLNISGNHLGPDLADLLLATIDKAPALTILNVENNDMCGARVGDFNGKALAHIARALTPSTSNIRELNLAGNNIQGSGAELLIATKGLQQVEILNLGRNGLGDAGAAIAAFAAQLPRLHTLDLSNNGIVDAAPLATLAKVTNSIQHLNLAHNLLGDGSLDSFVAFIDAVANRPQIVSLNLSANELVDAHTKSIAFLCHTATPPFEGLNLQQNPMIPLEDIIKLIQALARNTSIKAFKITSQEGDHEPILAALDAMLQQNKVLCDIDVGLSVELIEEGAVESVKQRLLLNALR